MTGSIKFDTIPKYSDWQCYLFGATLGNGFVWRPIEGQEPNWFWRQMQYLCFGNKWVWKPYRDKM